jgi:hypothetical protein
MQRIRQSQRGSTSAAALLAVGGLVVVAGVMHFGYELLTQSKAPPAPARPTTGAAPSKTLEQLQQEAAAQDVAAFARMAAEREQRAKAEREQLALQQAFLERATRDVNAKDAAFKRYYEPSPNCMNPDARGSSVECANEYMRIREAFEAKWASGEIR